MLFLISLFTVLKYRAQGHGACMDLVESELNADATYTRN